MKRKRRFLFIRLFINSAIAFLVGIPMICMADQDRHEAGEAHHHHEGEGHKGHHKAHHGGVLNVIGNCETGHMEVRIEGDTLETWLVGGGHDTDRSVPVKADEISLTVSVPEQGSRELILKADPLTLAGEKNGHCSHFVAHADWLKDLKEFEARGKLLFKGTRHDLFIKYPEGYDPDHGHGGH